MIIYIITSRRSLLYTKTLKKYFKIAFISLNTILSFMIHVHSTETTIKSIWLFVVWLGDYDVGRRKYQNIN